MMEQCKKKYLLCDGSKFDKSFFYNMGSVAELDGVISDTEIPENIRKMIKKDGE